MTSRAALFALLALWGVGVGGALPARAEETPTEGAGTEARADQGAPVLPGFTNRAWQRIDHGELPGVIRVFLSDGTLIMDSCWETHRLAAWRPLDAHHVAWNEDGTDINARIAVLSETRLTLVLELKGGPVTEHYGAAPVPSVCPDIPKA